MIFWTFFKITEILFLSVEYARHKGDGISFNKQSFRDAENFKQSFKYITHYWNKQVYNHMLNGVFFLLTRLLLILKELVFVL